MAVDQIKENLFPGREYVVQEKASEGVWELECDLAHNYKFFFKKFNSEDLGKKVFKRKPKLSFVWIPLYQFQFFLKIFLISFLLCCHKIIWIKIHWFNNKSLSLSSPSTVHCPCSTVDLPGIIADQESSQFSDIINWTELSWWLFFLNQLLWSLLFGKIVSLGNDIDLLFNQRSQDPTWANGVWGDSVFGILEGCGLGESNDTVLGGDISTFVDWGYQSVNWGDVDDSSPVVFKHVWDAFFGKVKGWAQVKTDDFFPLVVREISNGADELHTWINSRSTCVVDEDIDSAEDFDGFLDKKFAV